jgi:hypothetical protein
VGEITSQIEDTIAAERRELGQNLDELETKARALTDWRTHYRNHVGLACGAVFASAFVAGAVLGQRRYSSDAVDHLIDDEPAPRFASAAAPGRMRRQLGDTWDGVSSALLGVATAKIVDFVAGLIPGFREEYGERRPALARTGYPSDRYADRSGRVDVDVRG